MSLAAGQVVEAKHETIASSAQELQRCQEDLHTTAEQITQMTEQLSKQYNSSVEKYEPHLVSVPVFRFEPFVIVGCLHGCIRLLNGD